MSKDDNTPTDGGLGEFDIRRLSVAEWLKRDFPPIEQRGNQPIAIDDTPVFVRGEQLQPILWRGKQWAVTEYGIECLDGCYAIEKRRLLEELDTYGWPRHMGEKTWVDIDDFITAFLVALSLHGQRAKRQTLRDCIAASAPPSKQSSGT